MIYKNFDVLSRRYFVVRLFGVIGEDEIFGKLLYSGC